MTRVYNLRLTKGRVYLTGQYKGPILTMATRESQCYTSQYIEHLTWAAVIYFAVMGKKTSLGGTSWVTEGDERFPPTNVASSDNAKPKLKTTHIIYDSVSSMLFDFIHFKTTTNIDNDVIFQSDEAWDA